MTVIMGAPTLTEDQLDHALGSIGASPLFRLDMFPALWTAACHYGIDPVVMVAQSYNETGGGTFARAVKPWHRNTCGVKVRDIQSVLTHLPAGSTDEHPLCHAQFASWDIGAEAQAQHLRAYCQVSFDIDPVDPRYDVVVRLYGHLPPARTLDDLSGRWAPNPKPGSTDLPYGQRIQKIFDRLHAAVTT